jgi:hypothetical protein
MANDKKKKKKNNHSSPSEGCGDCCAMASIPAIIFIILCCICAITMIFSLYFFIGLAKDSVESITNACHKNHKWHHTIKPFFIFMLTAGLFGSGAFLACQYHLFSTMRVKINTIHPVDSSFKKILLLNTYALFFLVGLFLTRGIVVLYDRVIWRFYQKPALKSYILDTFNDKTESDLWLRDAKNVLLNPLLELRSVTLFGKNHRLEQKAKAAFINFQKDSFSYAHKLTDTVKNASKP